MKLNQLVAGAAIGCLLGTVGIGLGSGTATLHRRARGVNVLRAVLAVRAGLRRNADPAIRGVPAALPRNVDQVVPAIKVDTAVNPTSADPVDPVVPAVHPTSADPAVPVGPPGDSRGPGGPGGPPDFHGPGGPAAHPVTSTARAATIGGRRGIPRTTTGAGDSTAPRGVTGCRRGAGARRRRRYGMGRCLRRGGRRLRRSTTSASTSNRCGTPATTSGVSISSGSGFHYRSDRQPGETAASDNPGAVVERVSAASNGSAGA